MTVHVLVNYSFIFTSCFSVYQDEEEEEDEETRKERLKQYAEKKSKSKYSILASLHSQPSLSVCESVNYY